jgi:hypothetical protein
VRGDDAIQLARNRPDRWADRGWIRQFAQERRWHPTQELRILNNAGTRVEVCFHVSRLEEVVRWVLSWGSKAKVLGPPRN